MGLAVQKADQDRAEVIKQLEIYELGQLQKIKGEMKMSYEQISESTYYQNMSYWNQVAQNYRALGGLGICDDETGEELYTV